MHDLLINRVISSPLHADLLWKSQWHSFLKDLKPAGFDVVWFNPGQKKEIIWESMVLVSITFKKCQELMKPSVYETSGWRCRKLMYPSWVVWERPLLWSRWGLVLWKYGVEEERGCQQGAMSPLGGRSGREPHLRKNITRIKSSSHVKYFWGHRWVHTIDSVWIWKPLYSPAMFRQEEYTTENLPKKN